MNLFRQRSLQHPSPYRSTRLAFLDPLFCGMWCNQYMNDYVGNAKSFPWTSGFKDLFDGKIPEYCATNKKWMRDVDTLYIPHNLNNNHWIALEVNLLDGKVRVYDPDPSVTTAKQIQETCKPYAVMIPKMIKRFSPEEMRPHINDEPFKITRVMKGVPRNKQSGDCGVYTLKLIECLALGCTFEGLSDEYIGFSRLKYAIEFREQLPVQETIAYTDPGPRGLPDRAALLTASQDFLLDW